MYNGTFSVNIIIPLNSFVFSSWLNCLRFLFLFLSVHGNSTGNTTICCWWPFSFDSHHFSEITCRDDRIVMVRVNKVFKKMVFNLTMKMYDQWLSVDLPSSSGTSCGESMVCHGEWFDLKWGVDCDVWTCRAEKYEAKDWQRHGNPEMCQKINGWCFVWFRFS